MTEATISARVKSLETQLAILKAQMGKQPLPTPSRTLADLRGILRGKVQSDEADIQSAKYCFTWEGDSEATSVQ